MDGHCLIFRVDIINAPFTSYHACCSSKQDPDNNIYVTNVFGANSGTFVFACGQDMVEAHSRMPHLYTSSI